MIDTDKYEGHTREEWRRDSNDLWFHRNGKDTQIADILIRGDGDERYYEDVANARLIADAPLLLEEVKRWHKVRDYILERASYPTVKRLHLKDLLNFMEEVIE